MGIIHSALWLRIKRVILQSLPLKSFSRLFELFLMTNTVQTRTWMCLICGWIYDEASGLPDDGIAPGTRWEDIPPNWVCPECGARKEDFEMVEI